MIAIIIKTYNKTASLLNTIRSIEKYCDVPYRLYILDDGAITGEMDQEYRRLKSTGHFVEISSRHWPVTEARNYLVSQLQEELFVLRIDDDFEFTNRTSITTLIALLKMDDRIGVVSQSEIYCGESRGLKNNMLSSGQGFLIPFSGNLFKINIPVEKWRCNITDGKRWAYCDHARNFLLIRKELFKNLRWDEKIFFEGEHLDFMLTIMQSGWKMIFTIDSEHLHRDDLSVNDKAMSDQKRNRAEQRRISGVYLKQKWHFSRIVNYYPFTNRIYKLLLETIGLRPGIKSRHKNL